MLDLCTRAWACSSTRLYKLVTESTASLHTAVKEEEENKQSGLQEPFIHGWRRETQTGVFVRT